MIPDEIKKYRPKCTEIRYRNGTYYVYKITSVWDPKKKKAKKKTLNCIGKITEKDGFIPSQKMAAVEKVIVKDYGCYQLFVSLNSELYENLKSSFESNYREIFVIALIRLLNRATHAGIKRHFDASYLSEEYTDLHLSENTITSFMKNLGEQRSEIRKFMLKYVMQGETLLFDGTTIFTSSENSSYAREGYNSKKRKSKQVNLLYAFDKSNHAPVYYRLLPGNIVDKAAFVQMVRETGIENCIIIADKGFYSKINTSYLDENHILYILPLKDNTKYVDDGFLGNPNLSKYNGCFVYHDRVIWYKKEAVGNDKKYIYIFQDDGGKKKNELTYMKKKEADYGEYTMDDFFERQKRFGMLFFYSNIDVEPKEIYLDYKGRWEIEECFDYLKNSLDLGTVSQQSNEKIEAWAFLNHISLMMFYSLYRKLTDTKLICKYCPEDIIDISRNISKVKVNNQWYVSEVSKNDLGLLSSIGINL